jgi:long-chain acyl-CoA synthetase
VAAWQHGLQVVSYDRCENLPGMPAVACLAEAIDAFRSPAGKQAGLRLEQAALDNTTPDDLATILYTSGTTGEPKGVMLSQRNLVHNACATMSCFTVSPDDLRLTWLPLSHIFARTCDLYAWIAAGNQLALAESRETILANCAQLSPTLMNGVPYFFDKVMRRLVEKGAADQPDSLKKLLGGRMRFINSGGAALPDHVATFFQSHGVLLVQGYGLTESSPVITVNTDTVHKLGTVGRAIPDVEVRIAGDGEILTRGPHVMLGYWNKPQATAEALRDGWLHTGDLGELDSEGFLKITGRKKELIVLASGKNIAPVYLESLLTQDPLVGQAVVLGDERNYLTALLVPNFDALKAELESRGFTYTFPGEWLERAEVRALYAQHVAERLKDVSPSEQVRKFWLLERPFTLESGELTPTLKLRRGEICKHYAAEIEAMYAGEA